MRPAGHRQDPVRDGLEARRTSEHRFRTTRGAARVARRGLLRNLMESLVFDIFVVAGVLAVFGVVALIAKGVERL